MDTTTMEIKKTTRDRLKRFQLDESARKGERLTLSETIDALIDQAERGATNGEE